MTGEIPRDDELEVSLFGPGYGEALAVHVGAGSWVLVDSCLEPESRRPAQLHYLQRLGIDVTQAVKLIVVTHWHDDHVRGVGTLVRECPAADVYVSAALKSEQFQALLDLYGRGAFPDSSGVTEFVSVFRTLDERKTKGTKVNAAKLATPDRLLYSDTVHVNGENHEVQMYSLSPSDSAVMRAQLDFRQRTPVAGERKKRIVCPGTNNTAVVLWLRAGSHRVLLGSDLEKGDDPKTGWGVIVDESKAIEGTARVYKVAHHGAESSHDPNIWSKLLSDRPYALLSPWMLGDKNLPTKEDIDRLASLTPHAYVTAAPGSRRFRVSDRVVRDTVEGVTKSIRSINTGWGQVRLRCGLVNGASCTVDLFGDAHQISEN